MTLILDIILAGIFIVLVIAAAKKGFVLTVLEVVAIVAALFCASYISEPVSQGAYDTFLKDNIVENIDSAINEKTGSGDLGVVAIDSIPDYVFTFAECAGIDTNKVKANISTTISGAIQNGKTADIGKKVEENFIRPIAVPAIRIIVFFILFVILLVVFRLLAKAVSKIIRLPLVKNVDTVLGALLGALRGLAVLIIISTVFVTMLSGGDSDFAVAVRESKVIEIVNSINPFIDKLQNSFK
ncbi:MAG: CvpA family protein [Oscillospiraceae bacterium]|nr:CvpA family protein [Oscillospiraceae bacterium]